jgi:hypothetical protein
LVICEFNNNTLDFLGWIKKLRFDLNKFNKNNADGKFDILTAFS